MHVLLHPCRSPDIFAMAIGRIREREGREEHLERGRFKRARLYDGEKRLKLDPHLRSRASVRDTT